MCKMWQIVLNLVNKSKPKVTNPIIYLKHILLRSCREWWKISHVMHLHQLHSNNILQWYSNQRENHSRHNSHAFLISLFAFHINFVLDTFVLAIVLITYANQLYIYSNEDGDDDWLQMLNTQGKTFLLCSRLFTVVHGESKMFSHIRRSFWFISLC